MAEELISRINEISGRPAKETIRISEFQLAFNNFRKSMIAPLIEAAQMRLREHGMKAVAPSDAEESLSLLGGERGPFTHQVALC